MRQRPIRLIQVAVIFVFLIVFGGYAQAIGSHQLFTDLLSAYVQNDKVDYANLCRDQRLTHYTDYLNQTNPDIMPNTKERFAFWLNVYNAYSLKAICARYPIKSINELNFGGLIISVLLKKSVWDRPLVSVNHKHYNLRQVDHEILRPIFRDPRIQFTIACGAIGCPPMRQEAYEADKLDAQLQDQTEKFFNDPLYNSFDLKAKVAYLSPLLNWSKKDFGGSDQSVLNFITAFVSPEIKESIRNQPNQWKIIYNNYDLTLNDTVN